MDKLLLVDGSNIVNRAFYGLPPLTSNAGEMVNAVYGFAQSMINMIDKVQPSFVAVAFDMKAPTFRHLLYDGYKATRSSMPEDLLVQMPKVKNMLRSMGIAVLEQSGIEADDIIGTLAKHNDDKEVIIYSGDKDLYQLVDDNITIYMPQNRTTEVKVVSVDSILEIYGVLASQVVDLKSLMGDSSDNIPGVKGIGEKTAIKLLSEYNNLDNVYENIDNISGKLAEKLAADKDSAYLSKELATIDIDCDLGIDIDSLSFRLPFGSEVWDLFNEYNFKSLLRRRSIYSDDAKQNYHIQHSDNAKIVQINDYALWRMLYQDIHEAGKVAIHYDGMLWHMAIDNEAEYLISNIVSMDMIVKAEIDSIISDENVLKVLFDVKEFVLEHNLIINNYYDISIAYYLIEQTERILSLEDILKVDRRDIQYVGVELYNMYIHYDTKIIDNNLSALLSDIELPLIIVLATMQKNGIKIDRQALAELKLKYETELKTVEKEIFAIVGESFNLNSPQQMSEILFGKLGLKYKGKKSTGIEVLTAIADQHIVVESIIKYRKIFKLCSGYLSDFERHIADDGKVHTSFMQNVTSTGRLASRNPNLQNIPIRDDESKELRKIFISSFDNGYIVAADYNQIELRLMAHMSGDEKMISAFNNGEDIHKRMASVVFDTDINMVTSQQRRMAKAVNFGIIYGISEYGLGKNLDIPSYKAKEIIEKYFLEFDSVKRYMNECIENAKKQGYANTLYNRRRDIKELFSGNNNVRKFGERVAINMPIQGTASDIIKLAMLKVQQSLLDRKLKSKLILQIHDELIIDTAADEIDAVKILLKECMDNVIEISVPLIAEVNIGKNWMECK